MTKQEAIDRLISWANAQIGTHEGPNNWNPYAETEGLKTLYGWNLQNQPWCDVFVDAGFITCFGYDLGSAMTYQYAGCAGAACAQSAGYYKSAGAWSDTPHIGDQIFFYSGGGINHTGIVTHIGIGAITTVEGNSSDMVARRSYAVEDSKIAGYGRPNYALVEKAQLPADPEPEKPAEEQKPEPQTEITLRLPTLVKGSSGSTVELAQILLIGRGHTCGWYGVDGDFGPATELAVRNYQASAGLPVTGVIDPATWAALLRV